MKKLLRHIRLSSGMTLVEVMITASILGVVLLVISGVFVSTSRLYSKTNQRAGVQMNSRQGISIMMTEIRQAGADPGDPPIGVLAIVDARQDTIHVRSDLDGDGAIQTTEPSEDVTYFFDSTAQAILRDPGSGPQVIVPNVTAMTLSYFDASNTQLNPMPLSAADAARVRSVGLTITSEDRDSGAMTLTTRIALRNI